MNIPAVKLLTLECGRAIWLAAEPGKIDAIHRVTDQVVSVAEAFDAGALMLTDDKGATIVGPIDYAEVIAAARAAVTGKPHALTRPGATLLYATALVALDHERKS